MATPPTKPTVPPAPLRTEPETFATRAATMVAFFQTLVDYMSQTNDFTLEQAQAATAAVIAENIPNLDLSTLAGMAIGVNQAGDQVVGVTIPTLRAFATQAQAEAGTAEDVVMSPLRTAQAIEENATSALQFIHAIEASDGDSTIAFDAQYFDSSAFLGYEFHLQSVVPVAASSGFRARASVDDGANYESHTGTIFNIRGIDHGFGAYGKVTLVQPAMSGTAYLIRHFGVTQGATLSAAQTDSDIEYFRLTPFNTTSEQSLPVNRIEFSMSTGNFESGTIAMFGIRK